VVDEALGRHRGTHPFVDDAGHLEHPTATVNQDLDPVADAHRCGRLGSDVVDANVAAPACVGGRRPRLEQPHRPEPPVDPRRLHRHIVAGLGRVTVRDGAPAAPLIVATRLAARVPERSTPDRSEQRAPRPPSCVAGRARDHRLEHHAGRRRGEGHGSDVPPVGRSSTSGSRGRRIRPHGGPISGRSSTEPDSGSVSHTVGSRPRAGSNLPERSLHVRLQ
jgi:hypothetical protein